MIEQYLHDHDVDDLYRVRYENKVSPKTPMSAYYTITITTRTKHTCALAFRRDLYRWLDDIGYPSALYGYTELHPTNKGYHCHCITRTGWLPTRKRMNHDRWNIYSRKVEYSDAVSGIAIVKHYIDYSEKMKLIKLEKQQDKSYYLEYINPCDSSHGASRT